MAIKKNWKIRVVLLVAMGVAASGALLIGLRKTPTEANAHAWLTECNINFDNDFATTNLIGGCGNSFCQETKLDANGALTSCGSDDWSSCWVWRERCGRRGYVKMWPHDSWTHLHMFFDNPAIDDTAADGNPGCFCSTGYSTRVNGRCSTTCPDYKTENRDTIRPHDKTGWMYTYVEDTESGTGLPRVFDVARIFVDNSSWTNPHTGGVESAPNMAVWGRKFDGTVMGWDSLPPGNWDVSQDAGMQNLKELWTTTAAGFGTPAALREIVIRN